MEKFLTTETLIIELLLIVSLVAIAVQRVRVPYTVALVIVGLLITFQSPLEIELTPELILSLFVPPLIFEAAFHIDFHHLRRNLLPILSLAVFGVLLTTFMVGAIVALGIKLSWTTGFVFGALIAATDPVAVVALFRALGTPKQLTVLVESESLFNDGTAIVLFKLMVINAIAVAAGSAGGELDVPRAVVDFVRVSVGGLGIGIGLGWIISQIIARVDDYLIETTLTTVLAFGAYLIAERFHVSGVLAVVAAGIVTGNIGPKGMSPTTKIVLFNFWEYLAFVANSLVFLLIGLDVNLPQVISQIKPIGVALAAVIISRAIIVYGLTRITNLSRQRVPLKYQHVLFWGGLRGAISLALVLSLPASFGDRELLRVMTFGVVLFTLLVQGTTMPFLMRLLKLVQTGTAQLEYQRRHGRVAAARAAYQRLEELHGKGLITAATWSALRPELENRVEDSRQAQLQLLEQHPELQAEEREEAEQEALRAERATLATLLSNGLISERTYEELVTEVDESLEKRGNDKQPGGHG